MANNNEGDFNSLLKVYYQRVFPFKSIVSWLAHGDEDVLQRREFCFIISKDKDEIFLRHKCFSSCEELKKEMLRLCPIRTEIGPIFSIPPKDKDSYQLSYVPLERELVFDIDMDAYDPIRTCCSKEQVCQRCWVFLSIGIQVLDERLREDFGFEHLLWVYSGRRGVHCWVSDPRARLLSSEARSAIADYLAIVLSGKDSGTTVALKNRHPAFMETYENILEPAFENVLEIQDIFRPDRRQEILNLLPKDLAERFARRWSEEDKQAEENQEDGPTSLQRWSDLKKAYEKYKPAPGEQPKRNGLTPIQQIVFAFTWPRLDINVTKVMNHLLKSPFCIHPKTGKVCIPIDPKTCGEFEIDAVPRLSQIIREINEYDPSNAMDVDSKKPLKDAQKTSLAPHLRYFKHEFLLPLAKTVRQAKIQAKLQQNAAAGSSTLVDI